MSYFVVLFFFVIRGSRFLAFAGNGVTLERIAIRECLASSQWKFVSHQTLGSHCLGINAVKVLRWPGWCRPEMTRWRAEDKFDTRRYGRWSCFLVQRVRIQRGFTVTETAARRTPRTWRIGRETLKYFQ